MAFLSAAAHACPDAIRGHLSSVLPGLLKQTEPRPDLVRCAAGGAVLDRRLGSGRSDRRGRQLGVVCEPRWIHTPLIFIPCRIVNLGPFKHTVDEALGLRKAAFEALVTLLEGLAASIEAQAVVDAVLLGLKARGDDVGCLWILATLEPAIIA